jgi:hypothetical protein
MGDRTDDEIASTILAMRNGLGAFGGTRPWNRSVFRSLKRCRPTSRRE